MKISPNRRESAFTMVEIALCLAIVGFALVAIIGVLPTGMNVQKDNREETIINQDAAVWMDAIRNGSQDYDDLTNYVKSITVSSNGSATPFISANSTDLTLGGGPRIIGLLSIPKYVVVGGVPVTNQIVAFVRAMSGAAVEKPPQSNFDLRDEGFSYRMVVENTDIPLDLSTNVPIQSQALLKNSKELRILFRWPLLPNNTTGNGRQTYRTLIGGTKVNGRDGWPIFQPSTYK